MAQPAATLLIDIKAQTAKLQQDMRGVSNSIKSVETVSKNALRSIQSLGVGLGVSLGLRELISVNAEFKETLSAVQAVTNSTATEMMRLEKQARSLGASTVFSAKQAAEGQRFLGMAGFTTNQIIDAMPGLLSLASAGALELGDAADIASNILTGFRMEAGKINDVADILAVTASSSNTSVQQLGQAMKFAAPLASAMGVDIRDAAAAIGALGNAGIQAEMAGTGLRKIISTLASPSKNLESALRGVGSSLDDVDLKTNSLVDVLDELAKLKPGEAMEVFGERGGSAAIALAGLTENVRDLRVKIGDANGAAAEMAEVMQDNLAGAMKELRSAAEEVALELGESFDQPLTDSIRGTAAALRESGDEIKFVGVALAGAAIPSTLSGIAGGIRLVTAAMAANPLGILAVGATSAITVLISYRKELAEILGLTEKLSRNSAQAASGAKLDALEIRLNKLSDVREKLRFEQETIIKAIETFNTELAATGSKATAQRAAGNQLTSIQYLGLGTDIENLKLVKQNIDDQIKSLTESIEKGRKEFNDAIDEYNSAGSGILEIPAVSAKQNADTINQSVNEVATNVLAMQAALAPFGAAVDAVIFSTTNEIKRLADESERLEAQRLLENQIRWGESLTRQLDPLRTYNETLEELNVIREKGIIDQQTYTRAVIQANEQMRRSLEELLLSTREASNGALVALSRYADAAGDAARNMESVVGNSIRNLEDSFVDFATTGKFEIRSLVESALADLARLSFRQNVIAPAATALGLATGGSATAPLFNFGGFRAGGGDVAAGKTYMVGERGAELFTPKTSGQIVSNEQLQAMSANGNSAPTYNVTMNVYTQDATSFKSSERQIRRSMRSIVGG